MLIESLHAFAVIGLIVSTIALCFVLWLWWKDWVREQTVAVGDVSDRAFYWVIDIVMGCKGEKEEL